jgi:glucose-1-phosphate thymidylyltransferase
MTGTAGVGKTRLAIKVAHALLGDFRNGVLFVPLAPVRDILLVLPSIAQALGLAEKFSRGDDVAVVLGDNIFQDNVQEHVKSFKSGARIFLKTVPDAHRFGVAEVDHDKNLVLGIEEKPASPRSNYAVTGLYIYDHKVFDIVRTLKPSKRGELESTDVNNEYIRRGELSYSVLEGYWSDAGTFESLYRASEMVRNNINKN